MKNKIILVSIKIVSLVLLMTCAFGFSKANAATESIKIGFITDFEYGSSDIKNKLCTKAPEYLKSVVKSLDKKNPDIVIGGGDYIEASALTETEARKQLEEVNNIFKELDAKKYYAVGNHDLRSLTYNDYKDIFDIDYLHKAIDSNGFRLIILDTNYKNNQSHRKNEDYVEGYVAKKELRWLERQIDDTANPVIIFAHHSPARPGGSRSIRNSDDVIEVLEKSGRVVAYINGHTPTQEEKIINGIHYITINNLTNVKSRKTFGFIRATKEDNTVTVSINQYGTKKRSYEFSKEIR